MITRNAPLFFGLILGIALGLVYGWFIQPSEYEGSNPDSLREDHVVDYVLMTAQIFDDDQDIELARRRLSFLGTKDEEHYVQSVLSYAEEHDFNQTDLAQLKQLSDILMQRSPSPEASPP